MKIYLDTETRSEVSIANGTSAYVNGKYFAVLMVQYALDNGPVQVWEPIRQPMPDDLATAIRMDDHKFIIHNSAFDRNVINRSGIFGRDISPDEIVDTMVQALSHGFPGSLEALCEIFRLGIDKAKDKRGKQLIQRFCVPVPRVKYLSFNSWDTHPEEWKEFREYGMSDIRAMREIHRLLPTVNYPDLEHGIWVVDQRINDRGIPVDVDLAVAALRERDDEINRLNDRTAAITLGEVAAATQRDKLIEHIAKQYGIRLPALRSKDVQDMVDRPDAVVKAYKEDTGKLERMMSSDLPQELRELLSLRVQSSMNTVAKYRRVIDMQTNGRMRYTMQMYGAQRTGRDAGRGLQPQNLRRATLWKDADDIEMAIEADVVAVKDGYISTIAPNVMLVLSDLVRSVICASPGHKLVAADLANIEGRSLVYLSGEEWKLQYFRDFDAGKIKYDNYKMAYAKAMNIPPEEVTKEGRQIGKVQELGLGYEGGVRAFLTFAAVYRLDLKEMANAVWASGDTVALKDCAKMYAWAKEKGFHGGLSEPEFSACEYLKRLWRKAHPKTVRFWGDLATAFRNAVVYPNETFEVGKLKFKRVKNYLFIKLPSGRCLCYLSPKVEDDGTLSFMGVSQFTKKFERIKTYSGKLAENVTSGFARDVLFHRMPDIEQSGYPIVLRVHDELVCECPDLPEYSSKKLAALMATPPTWCSDLPLSAAGFEAHRYRKD